MDAGVKGVDRWREVDWFDSGFGVWERGCGCGWRWRTGVCDSGTVMVLRGSCSSYVSFVKIVDMFPVLR